MRMTRLVLLVAECFDITLLIPPKLLTFDLVSKSRLSMQLITCYRESCLVLQKGDMHDWRIFGS